MCEAEELYKKANSLMYAHEGKCDYKKAVELYTLAAEKGHLKSLQNLARIYKDGQIVVKDMDLSIKYYIKCAESGDIYSQFTLGNLYHKGELVEQNLEKAFYWYEKAAKRDFDKAQNNLGNMYKNGIGAEKNYIKAAYWYERASSNGNKAAKTNLNNMIEYNSDAMYELALSFLSEGDEDKAYEWFNKAAVYNHTLSLKMMGDFYIKKEDIQKAVYCYKQAANQGNGESAEIIGDYYLNTSVKLAEKYYKIAVQNGIKGAIKKLADLYIDPRRFIKKKAKAKALYEMLSDE